MATFVLYVTIMIGAWSIETPAHRFVNSETCWIAAAQVVQLNPRVQSALCKEERNA